MSQLLNGLYVITDEQLTPDEHVHSYVEDALIAGASIVQYRNKTKSDEEVEAGMPNTSITLYQL